MGVASESATIDRQSEMVRIAYDRIAPTYEQEIAGDDWMRRTLWRHYLSTFQSGDHVLDVACGTGLDAVFLAGHGIKAMAVDVSPGMIERLRARAESAGLLDAIDPRVSSIEDLAHLQPESFDGIISAFAGLSTVADLHRFARDAARLLRPGGRMVLHMLNQFSLWEWLSLLKRGEWNAARALGRTTEREFVIGGVPVRHYLYRSTALYRSTFAEQFTLSRAYGLGCLRPPHTLHTIPPRMANGLGGLDGKFGNFRLLRDRGRFFVLELSKCSSDDDANPTGASRA